MADADQAQQIKSLEGLLVDEHLQDLEQRLGRFNIFDALGVARAEIRHSNFLAWLLDPYGSHGQGDLFLKAVLIDLLRQSPAQQRLFSPVMIDGRDRRGVEIRREWRNIDLLITCEDPLFVVAIENKVGSGEHSGQLGKYEAIVRGVYGQRPKMFVYLTVDRDDASDEDWVSYSYKDIHDVLERTARIAGHTLGSDVAAFLSHYLRLLKAKFMNDAHIDALCRQIYKNHKEAIDLIVERAGVGDAGIPAAFARLLEELGGDWVLTGESGSRVYFMRRAWLAKLAPIGEDEGHDGRDWLAPFVGVKNQQCFIGLRSRAVSSKDDRNAVIERLCAAGNPLGCKPSFRTWKQQKRVLIWFEKIEEWEDGDEIDGAAVAKKAFDRLMACMERIDATYALI